MATHTLTPPRLREGPFIDEAFTIEANGHEYITPGFDSEGVPQVFALEALYAALSCSAVVANRYFRWIWKNQSGASLFYMTTTAVTASQNKNGEIGPLKFLDGIASVRDDWYWGIDKDSIILVGDDVLDLYIYLGQTGDECDITARFRYLNKELGMPTPYRGI